MFSKLREKLKGYKTVVFNIILAMGAPIAVALQKLDAIDWTQYVGPFGAILVGFVIAGIGLYLRWVTTGPVGSKGDEAPAPEVKAGD